MTGTVLLTHSEHVCRVISTVFGVVLVGVCAVIAFIHACRWVNQVIDNRQYKLETDRKVKLERVRWEAMAEREEWRSYDEYLAQALAGYAKENYQMREFMKKCKVADLYEEWRKKDDKGTAYDAD